MDKYEYKIRTEEIKELIAQREYAQAAEIADTIDWRRVKSVMMLCTISDLYKINRRYEDSMDLLLLAYERHPGGRTIVYSLCELAIKMGDYTQALEYCREFIQIAPKDSGRYILQYKLYEAQDVSLEEQIAVLEELKKRDYREKWAYELAYLYHRVGLATKCVEECDELIVWFGDGKYVIKAMELKMLHKTLTPEQQEKYDVLFQEEEGAEAEEAAEETAAQEAATEVVPEEDKDRTRFPNADADILTAATTRIPTEELEIQIKTMGVDQYDTINLQAEVAAGVKEFLEKQEAAARAEEEPVQQQEAPEEFAQAYAEAESTEEMSEEAAEISVADTVMEQMRTERQEELPGEMAKVLSMEADGQISFVVSEKEALEKQITGQLSIADIMAEWERMKAELEEKRKENVRRLVQQNTDAMFTEFEESIRDGLLEQLEGGRDIAEVLAEAEGRISETAEMQETSEEIDESAEEIDELAEEIDEAAEMQEVSEEIDEAAELQETAEEIDEVEELTEIEEDMDADAEETENEEELREASAVSERPDREPVSEARLRIRNLTREEKELFGPYIQGRTSKEQIINTIDNISLAAYTGNVIITGAEGVDTLGLAKNFIREIQLTDSNFSGKIAKISSEGFNKREAEEVLSGLSNGALIIQKAGGLSQKAAEQLYKALQREDRGIIVILEGTKKTINALLERYTPLESCFSARVDMEALSDAALVAFGKKYARENEHSIDEFGILALHRTITERQTSDHVVTISEVKEIIDDAIDSADRKTLGHFFAVITAKRYDEEDMIIIREKDFL